MSKLTQQQAIDIHNSKVWENWTSYEKVRFQLFEDRLCMPFDVFHEAIEQELGRPVYTHEFGLNREGITREFLGTDPTPSFDDIINLIPPEKRIIIGF